MKPEAATGFQITFLVFAVCLLAVPAAGWFTQAYPSTPDATALLERGLQFVLAAVILFAFPGLRRRSRELLRVPVPAAKSVELATVSVLQMSIGFAWAGSYVLWHWLGGGETGAASAIRALPSHEREMAQAFMPGHLVKNLLLVTILVPLVEEIVFRGLLLDAWRRAWGDFPAIIASSAVFAIYHANFAPAFVSGVVSACLYVRTGSLRACIIAHAIFNLLAWYPFLGHLAFPRGLEAPGDLGSWWFHLACLLFVAVTVPTYLWMARHKAPEIEDFPPTVIHGALQK